MFVSNIFFSNYRVVTTNISYGKDLVFLEINLISICNWSSLLLVIQRVISYNNLHINEIWFEQLLISWVESFWGFCTSGSIILMIFPFNPITLRAAKRGLTILEIFHLQKHFLENIWRRNVDHEPDKKSPSNILWIFALFKRYFQKYESSRWHFLEKL